MIRCFKRIDLTVCCLAVGAFDHGISSPCCHAFDGKPLVPAYPVPGCCCHTDVRQQHCRAPGALSCSPLVQVVRGCAAWRHQQQGARCTHHSSRAGAAGELTSRAPKLLSCTALLQRRHCGSQCCGGCKCCRAAHRGPVARGAVGIVAVA